MSASITYTRREVRKFYAGWGPSSHGAQLARSRAGRLGVYGGGEEWVSLASDPQWFGLVRQIWNASPGLTSLLFFGPLFTLGQIRNSYNFFRWNSGSRVKLTFQAVPR